MPVIDSDAHVIENESAWDYMLESERQFRPKLVAAANGDPAVDFWLIDGRLMPRSNVEKKLPRAARGNERSQPQDQAHGRIERRYPGDLSDGLYFSHGAPGGGRPRPVPQLQPLAGRHHQKGGGPFPLDRGSSLAQYGTCFRGIE